jgi:hypothetical protein
MEHQEESEVARIEPLEVKEILEHPEESELHQPNEGTKPDTLQNNF